MDDSDNKKIGILLNKTLLGENLYKITFIGKNGSCNNCLKKSKKNSNPFQGVDLFDTAEFLLKSSKHGGEFLQEIELLESRRKLAFKYESYLVASEISHLMDRNSKWLDEEVIRFQLVEISFDKLLENRYAPVVYLKFLFKLVELEGYPIRQDWIQELRSNQADIKKILSTTTQYSENYKDKLLIDNAKSSLLHWIRSNTDFYI
jgi:recombinational DNA repair protein (RecF pathway)